MEWPRSRREAASAGRGAGPSGWVQGAGLAQEKAPLRPQAAPPWPRVPRPRTALASGRARRSAAAREPKGSGGRAVPAARLAAVKETREAQAGRVRTAGAPDLAGGGVSKALCLMASLFTEFTL